MHDEEYIKNWHLGLLFQPIMDESYLVKRMRENGLRDEAIAGALMAINATCHYCWDYPDDCQCWNDE